MQREMCRGKVHKCGILKFFEEEYVQLTDSDDNNYETEDDEDMYSDARNLTRLVQLQQFLQQLL